MQHVLAMRKQIPTRPRDAQTNADAIDVEGALIEQKFAKMRDVAAPAAPAAGGVLESAPRKLSRPEVDGEETGRGGALPAAAGPADDPRRTHGVAATRPEVQYVPRGRAPCPSGAEPQLLETCDLKFRDRENAADPALARLATCQSHPRRPPTPFGANE